MKDRFDELLTRKIEESFNHLEIPYNSSAWDQIRDEVAGVQPSYLTLFWKSNIVRTACIVLLVSASGYYFFQDQLTESPVTSLETEITEPKHPETPSRQTAPPQKQKLLAQENKQHSEQVGGSGPDQKIVQPVELPLQPLEPNAAEVYETQGIERRELGEIFISNALIESEPVDLEVAQSKAVPVVSAVDIDRTGSKTGISILASPTLNYSEAETKGSAGFTAGILSDYPLTKRMRISSGLILGRQNLRIEESGTNNLTIESGVGAFSSSTTADLLTLDIPLNLQYTLSEQKNRKSYVSVGVSSYVFLKEQYAIVSREVTEVVQESDDGSIERFTVIDENTDKESNSSFSTVDFAEVLNLAIGFNYRAGKKTDVVIEPFVKYPLGSLTSKNVQLGSGGINIRIRFR